MACDIAYSYIRFSSQKQLRGDSLRRQLALARAYADAHKLVLDESLTYKDLGVSAYDRSNIERGALSKFLELVRAGRIPRGAFLLVEQFDRLSRADVFTAFGIFSELVKAGINLVTLADDRVYDSTTTADLGSLMMSISIMYRSHEESLAKSRRVRSAWKAKRDSGANFMTSECPRWLKPNSTKTGYLAIPDRVESVRKVFEATAGGFGNVSIVRRANQEKWAVPGKADIWHTTLVTKLIRNRSTLGEYQPMTKLDGKRVPIGEPRMGFYPVVIEEALFLRANASKATRAQLPRRRDKDYMNIFQGVLRCGCCGASMLRKNKGSRAQPGYVQYLCAKRIIGAEPCRSISALKLEPPLLRHIFDRGFIAVGSDAVADFTRDELSAAQAYLASEVTKRRRVIDAIEEAETSGALIGRLLELEATIATAQADVAEKRMWLEALTASVELDDIVADYELAYLRIKQPLEIEYRAALHERILRVVEDICVFGDTSTVTVRWRNKETSSIRIEVDGSFGVLSQMTRPLPLLKNL